MYPLVAFFFSLILSFEGCASYLDQGETPSERFTKSIIYGPALPKIKGELSSNLEILEQMTALQLRFDVGESVEISCPTAEKEYEKLRKEIEFLSKPPL